MELRFFMQKMIQFDESIEKKTKKLCIFMSNNFRETNVIWREFECYATNKLHCAILVSHVFLAKISWK